MTDIVKPVHRRAIVVCTELLAIGIIGVVVSAEGWVPERAFIGIILSDAARKIEIRNVVCVSSDGSVVGMASSS